MRESCRELLIKRRHISPVFYGMGVASNDLLKLSKLLNGYKNHGHSLTKSETDLNLDLLTALASSLKANKVFYHLLYERDVGKLSSESIFLVPTTYQKDEGRY